VPKKEESLIDEMRAAIAHDREQLGRRGTPVLEVPERAPEPEGEPPRKSLLARLLGRDG
jgi:hypothetical protein